MADAVEPEPDPNGWLPSDDEGLVLIESTSEAGGEGLRIGVVLKPNSDLGAHWNNDAGPTQLWVAAPEGWALGQRLYAIPNPATDVSDEPRRFELEVGRLGGGGEGTVLRGYAVYFVCEGETGVCMSRRQNVEVTLPG
jgi:hypothetical protein